MVLTGDQDAILSPAQLDRLAVNLAKIALTPAQHFAVTLALADALLHSEEPVAAKSATANSATPRTAKSAHDPVTPGDTPARKRRHRKANSRRSEPPGAKTKRAKQILSENPHLTRPKDLANAANVSWACARNAILASKANGTAGAAG